MRRFASVFAPKRADKSDNPSQGPPPQIPNLKRAHTVDDVSPPSLPALQLMPSDHASSSSGSGSLRTPDDDVTPVQSRPGKRSWRNWLGGSMSAASRKSSHHNRHQPREWDKATDTWQPVPVPILKDPPFARARESIDTEEDESSSESDDDSESGPHNVPQHDVRPLVTLGQGRENIGIFTSSKLVPPLSPPPLLHLPGSPFYPRSSNLRRDLVFQETVQSTMQRQHLLERLKGPLTPKDAAAILPFASRQTPSEPQTSLPSDDIVAPDAKKVSSVSRGLKRWILRKPFEERMLTWAPNETGGVRASHVKGTAFGVPEIEFSEHLEVIAGIFAELDQTQEDWEPPEPEPEPEASVSSSEKSAYLTVPADTRKAPYKAIPSPLRMQHSPTSPRISPAPSPNPPSEISVIASTARPPSPDTETPEKTPAPPPVKRGVHFMEDDKDDQIPLGYIMRMKKRREDKARFLRQEQVRRAFDLEKLKVEKERMQREKERLEWEKERRAWEREKKALEDERKQRLYAEEVAAARVRREARRHGPAGNPNYAPQTDPQIPKPRDTRPRQRPVYDPMPALGRRQASDPTTGSGGTFSASPITGSSPGSSRQSSFLEPPTPGGSQRNSRPASVYSTLSSAEDLRMHDPNSRRNSASSSKLSVPASPYATWSGPVVPMPAIPVMPMFMIDMPLLPPTPPFMLQQYPQRQHSPSSSKRNNNLPNDHSSERSHQPEQQYPRRFSNPSSFSDQTHSLSASRPPSERGRPSTADGHTNVRLPRSASQPYAAPFVSQARPPPPSFSLLQPPPVRWMHPRTASAPNVTGASSLNRR